MRSRVAVLLLAVAAGCGGPRYAPVSGRVTLDGKPLAGAVVTFLPAAPDGKADAGGPGSVAVTDARGEYRLAAVDAETPGALVGEHRVRVSTAAAAGADGKERVPARYNTRTELRFVVPPGGAADADFPLRSR